MDKARDNQSSRHAKLQNAHPTIGLLIDNIWDPIAWDVWAGVDDTVKEQGANSLCFVGGALRSRLGFSAQANVLYDLVSAENVDGLVIWGGGLGQLVSPEEVRAFYEQYHPLPIVNAALPLEGIPSILVDNYQGMREAMVHLTKVHGYRRIAFIRGPEGHPEADERYRAYIDVLAEHGLPLDPNLVAPGDFNPESGTKAINLLLDQRKLLPRTDFKAIVAVDDGTAIRAIEELQAREIQVPGDVAVIGFDNIEDSSYITPPLTTVSSLVYEQARRATEMVLALLEGEQVPDQVLLPTQLVVRQSCGCLASAVEQAAVGAITRTDEMFEIALAARREDILTEMAQAVEALSVDSISEGVEQLLDTFLADLRGESSDIFLSTLDKVLHQTVGDNVILWQRALSVLRRHALPYLGDDTLFRAEDLWQQARVVIGETAQRGQAYQRLETEKKTRTLNTINQELSTTFDVTELMNVVAQRLPGLGIESAYISLYDDPGAPAEWSRLILAYDRKGRVALEADGRRFPSRRLVPDDLLDRDRRYSIVIEPLYFQEDQLGFAVFEANPREATIYDALRGHISGALKGALLLQERKQAREALEKAYAEVEQQVEERTAELKQEIAKRERAQAEGQRAQAEGQRLQQEVIEAQRRALQELSTPIIPVMERVIVMPLIGSIDSMRARDIMRTLLAGIREHRAKVVILDITGVLIVDSGVANHLNKTIQAARLKGARTIVTGISDAVAETIVDLGIDWGEIETLTDLRTGLIVALDSLGIKLTRKTDWKAKDERDKKD